MWPHHRHQHYRVDEVPESHQYHQPQHLMHPAIGTPLSSSTMIQSTDALIVTGQNHDHQQQSMQAQQQQRQNHHPHHHHHHHPNQQQQQQQRQQQQQQQQQQHRDHPMTLPAPSNPRASRNMAEKQRRDNLNTNISNMATLVPTVAGSPRRLDKISILRLGATYLRTEYALGSGNGSFLPCKFNKVDLEKFLFDTLVQKDGFLVVVTSTGKIIYVGCQVEQHLGHAQTDLLGQSLYNFVYPDDHEELTKNLTPNESSNRLMIAEGSVPEENSSSSEDSRSMGNKELLFGEERRSFNVRMSQRAASRRENVQYECLHISGLLRPADACRNLAPGSERARRHLEMNTTSNDIIFVGIARMIKRRITELSLLEANKEEYVTRHLLDGRIIFCDHRISVVAGYMTHEVSGMSAFSYMHSEDVLWTIVALRQMYDRGEGFGSSCYRLKTKTGEYIYLRTHAYIEVDKDRHLFESFICVNTSVSKEEGEKLVNDMKSRYSATIASPDSFLACEDTNGAGSDTQCSTPKVAVEDPSQLENAISHLISELAPPPVADDRPSSSALPDEQSMKAVLLSQHFPPPAIQANKIGIKCIDHPVPSSGKGKTIKRESNVGSPASIQSRQSDNLNDFEEPRSHEHTQMAIDSSSVRRGDKIIPETSVVSRDDGKLFHSQSAMPNVRYATTRSEDYYKIEASPSSSITSEESSPRESSSHSETKKSPLRQTRTGSTNIRPGRLHRGKPESMFAYVKTENIDYSQIESTESPKISAIKRSANVNDSPAMVNKKQRRANKNVGSYSAGGVSVSVDNYDSSRGQYDGKTSPFVASKRDERLANPVRCKIESPQAPMSSSSSNDLLQQPDNNVDSSSLHDLPIDYHTLNPSNIDLSVYEDEQLDDFSDLQSESFLSPNLDDNPDFMKIFDDLGPVIDFKKSLDDRTMQPFSSSDQVVSEGLKKTHMELENRMTMQKNKLCVLEHELGTPALQSKFFKPRETLIELRAEHKKNTRMLKTIQQDHHNNMQTNSIKQNIGV